MKAKAIVILLVLIIGCEYYPEQNIIAINVHESANVSIHECFDQIGLIPLETREETMIRYIMKIIKYEDFYFILDYNRNIYKIDSEGNFLCEIGGIGRGPEEHLEVEDIQINEYTGNLELLIPRGKIDVFSTDGTFIESLVLGTYAHDFLNVSEDLILIHFSVGAHVLSFYSRSKRKVIAQAFPMEEEIIKKTTLGDTGPIWKWNGDVYFQYPFSNTIYKMDGTRLHHYYTLDCGKHSFDISDISNEPGLDRDQISEKLRGSENIATYFHFHVENDNFVLKRFLNGDVENMPSFLFDKSTSESKVFVDFAEGVRLPMLYHYDPDTEIVYAAVEPEDIQKYIAVELLEDDDTEKLKDIEISDNPVMVEYHLK